MAYTTQKWPEATGPLALGKHPSAGVAEWHEGLPAENGDAVLLGYYSAKGDVTGLETLAEQRELTSANPEVYAVLKRYGAEQQSAGWLEPSPNTRTYLQELAGQRWTAGSASADNWLQALGEAPLEDVLVLPMEERRTVSRARMRNSQEPLMLEAYPNPTTGFVYLACNVPEGVTEAVLNVRDVHGKLIQGRVIGVGTAVVELDLTALAPGVYDTELGLDGIGSSHVKVVVQ